MIDEKRLGELHQLTKVDIHHDEFDSEMSEVFRLARLGLWARDVGVPALKKINEEIAPFNEDHLWNADCWAVEALSKLPKDTTK